MHVEEDERIHGDSAFAEKVLDHASERMQRRYRLPAKGVSPDTLAQSEGEIYGLEKEQVAVVGKQRSGLCPQCFCFLGAAESGLPTTEVGAYLGMSKSVVSRAVTRGRKLVAGGSLVLEE